MGKFKHPRQAMVRGVAGTLGGVLVASVLTAAPAQGAILGIGDDLVDPVPKIDGIGSIVGPDGYECTSDQDLLSLLTCAPLPLDLLDPLSPQVLQAVPTPGSGFEFDGWEDCPDTSGTVCTIPVDLLGQLVSPIAQFVPIPDDGGGGGEEPGTTPPTVTISSWNPGESPTRDTNASFQFAMEPATQGWSFECQLTGPTAAHVWTRCPSGQSYSGLEPGSYTFSVRATDGAASPTTSQPDSQAWVVEEEQVAAPASVTIASGPGHKEWLAQDFAQLTYRVEPADASVVCRLNGRLKSCSPDSVLLRNLSGRTHTFTVTATDAEGESATARRSFSVPRNNTQLKHSKGDWTKASGKRHFRSTYSETDKRRSVLKTGSKRIKRVALMVTKAPGHGKVKVMLGKKVLKRVDLSAKKVKKSQLIPVKTFRRPKRGTIKVVVISRNKTVQIEGLGIASR